MLIEAAFFRLPIALSGFSKPRQHTAERGPGDEEERKRRVDEYEGMATGMFAACLVEELSSWYVRGAVAKVRQEVAYPQKKKKTAKPAPRQRCDIFADLSDTIALPDYGSRDDNWIEVKFDPQKNSNLQEALWGFLIDIARLGRLAPAGNGRYALLISRCPLSQSRLRGKFRGRESAQGAIEDLRRLVTERRGNRIEGSINVEHETGKYKKWLAEECEGEFQKIHVKGTAWEFSGESDQGWSAVLLRLDNAQFD